MTDFFQQVWHQYTQLNPEALKIHQLLQQDGETIENDHVAFRTLKSDLFGVSAHESFFQKMGYEKKGEYHFDKKKLYASHMEHKDSSQPKVFVSELLIDECASEVQASMRQILDEISGKSFEDVFLKGHFWKRHFETYQSLNEHSEYAAWFYNHGFCANHFTVSVNALSKYSSVAQVNEWLKGNGFVLNSSGGEIKGSEQQMLMQSSTMSSQLKLLFEDGEHEVPGCYYEFAQRFPEPSGELYQGFVTTSADKIFESTNERN